MEIPKFHETFLPILYVLSNGEAIRNRVLYQNVINKYYNKLTEEQLKQKTKTGDLLIHNRIAWGKSYLKKGEFIEYPERGYVKITQKGMQQKNKLTLKDVVEEKSLLEFYQEENTKSSPLQEIDAELKTSSPQDLIDEGFKLIENEVKPIYYS